MTLRQTVNPGLHSYKFLLSLCVRCLASTPVDLCGCRNAVGFREPHQLPNKGYKRKKEYQTRLAFGFAFSGSPFTRREPHLATDVVIPQNLVLSKSIQDAVFVSEDILT